MLHENNRDVATGGQNKKAALTFVIHSHTLDMHFAADRGVVGEDHTDAVVALLALFAVRMPT